VTWLPVLALRFVDPPTTAFMISGPREGPLRHEWLAWPELGTNAALAVIAAEDQKFAQHFGFDFASIRAVLEQSGRGDSLRGASTISQQTAKNLFLWSGRNLVRKGLEAYFTVLIEITWPKRRILEVYLNVAQFGAGLYGVGAASQVYFGKSAQNIDDSEAALLAAVLPNPLRFSVERPSSYVRERQRWILGQMQRLRRERVLALIEQS